MAGGRRGLAGQAAAAGGKARFAQVALSTASLVARASLRCALGPAACPRALAARLVAAPLVPAALLVVPVSIRLEPW